MTDIIEHLAAIEKIKARDDGPSWEYIRALCGKAATEIILLRVAAAHMAEDREAEIEIPAFLPVRLPCDPNGLTLPSSERWDAVLERWNIGDVK